jgi:hypothetical protein
MYASESVNRSLDVKVCIGFYLDSYSLDPIIFIEEVKKDSGLDGFSTINACRRGHSPRGMRQ